MSRDVPVSPPVQASWRDGAVEGLDVGVILVVEGRGIVSANQAGGGARITSRRGAGTVVEVVLPLVTSPDAPPAPARPVAALSGPEVPRRMQSLVPGLAVLHMSGHTAGLTAHIPADIKVLAKPFTAARVRAAVRRAPGDPGRS